MIVKRKGRQRDTYRIKGLISGILLDIRKRAATSIIHKLEEKLVYQ